MTSRKITIQAVGDQCERCGYPFDPGDEAYQDTRDDASGPVYCSINCHHRDKCDESLAAYIAQNGVTKP